MKIVSVLLFLICSALASAADVSPAPSVNIKPEHISFLIRLCSNFSCCRIVTIENIKDKFVKLTGFVAKNTDLDFQRQLDDRAQAAAFCEAMDLFSRPSFLERISEQQPNYKKVQDVLLSYSISFDFNERYQAILLSSFKELLDVKFKVKDKPEITALSEDQIVRIVSELVSDKNRGQDLSCDAIKSLTQSLFQKSLKGCDQLEEIKVVLAQKYAQQIIQRIPYIFKELGKKLILNPLYEDIQKEFCEQEGLAAIDIDKKLQQVIILAFRKHESQFYQTDVSPDEILMIAREFGLGQIVTYEKIKKKFFLLTGRHFEVSKILRIPSFEQEKIVLEVQEKILELAKAVKDINRYPILNNFLQQYGCDKDVSLDFEYRYKGSIDRLINALRMKACIRQNGWDCLAVASKCVQKIGNEIRVFARKVKGGSAQNFSKKEIEQLVALVEVTGYQDWGFENSPPGNLIREKASGKIVFIDTEDKSFKCHGRFTKIELCKLMKERLYVYMQEDAKVWFDQHGEDLEKKEEEEEGVLVLPSNNCYDDSIGKINFDSVKKECEDYYLEIGR